MRDECKRARTRPMERRGSRGISMRAAIAIRQAADTRGNGFYNAKRLRSQQDVIRDVMLSAAECDTWLTLAELRALTQYGEASISAQLRHLRKAENGAFIVRKRRRSGSSTAEVQAVAAGRNDQMRFGAPAAIAVLHMERPWEYRIEQRPRVATARAARDTLMAA